MAIWDDIITERDGQVYSAAGFGLKKGLGERPALLIIDVNYDFVGERPEPILDSVKRFPKSCGLEGWQAVAAIRSLLEVARARGIPVIYTTTRGEGEGDLSGVRLTERGITLGHVPGVGIVAEVAPAPGEIVLVKDKPSAFFGTPLMAYLNQLDVDTLLVCGGTTSGCVRATVVDASSYFFKVGVVLEGTFDRGQASHKVNLFDMNAKYADVISLKEAREYLMGLEAARGKGSS